MNEIGHWRIFWITFTALQGLIAVFSDISHGYSNCSVAQLILIFYTMTVSTLGIYQYRYDYFYFMKNDRFDTHLLGNIVLSTWILGLFDVGWYMGVITMISTLIGMLYRFVFPYDNYEEVLTVTEQTESFLETSQEN